jgi:rhamnogalacturonan endolyase
MIQRHTRRRHPSRAAYLEALESRTLFSFGISTGAAPTGQSTYVIDNGGNVKFSIIKGGSTSNTLHLGDMSSLQYKGKELLAPYSASGRYSHYEQGLGNTLTTITTATGGTTGSRWILVTCDDSTEASGGVIQYYGVRENDNNLYLLSLPTDVNNGPGEGRYIAYLSRSVFTAPEVPSDNAPHSASDVVSAIEGSDVFGHTDGAATVQATSSKFFNMGRRMIDNTYHGLTATTGGVTVGAWMFIGNREHSASGPFMKDIDFQASTTQVELYNCIFTGHDQTEPFRQGLHTYALQLTDGSAPTMPDYSWLENVKDSSGNLLIHGLIPAAQRGTLTGTASGMVAGHQTVIALSNTTAQYWTYANSSTGAYTITGIQPGTYTETLYDNELAVGTKTLTITASQTTTANILNAFYSPAAPIFRIGAFDGTPIGFLNTEIADPATGARKIEIMHPSDVRMNSWTATPNFVVGTNTDAQWNAAQFMGVNNSQKITFTLAAAQVQNLTLRIGITWGFAGARPKITVNSGQSYAWTSANPSASYDLKERGITRGTWRGVNQLYTFDIPASAFRAGTNTIDVPLISGSYSAGQTWLSPNVAYDALDLVPTAAAYTPAIAGVTVTPTGPLNINGTRTFTAVAKDSSGNIIKANFAWSAALGSIDANGNYTAPAAPGTDTITVIATTTGTPGYKTTASSTSAFTGIVSRSGSIAVSVIPPAPAMEPITVNEGSAQRSMVTSITLRFSAPVTLAAGAVTLALHSPDNVGSLPGSLTWSTADGGLSYTVTFSGNNTFNGSLADGVYDLTLHASLITDAWSQPLSGGDQTTTFHRLYGDANGDALIDGADLGAFATGFGLTAASPTFPAYFDIDGDGKIDGVDLGNFATNFGKRYRY